jgi:hypothetical protein
MKTADLISIVVGAVLSLALFPIVQGAVTTAKVNASDTISAILDIVPILYIFVVVGGMIAYLSFKSKN